MPDEPATPKGRGDGEPVPDGDPVVEAYKRHLDRTLLR